mmetsp:Transcript_73258/g.176801  ORF Transcript_73258/g.176801 Transcript_73258/m.176801 type:complete len:237 (-) Transcript_73258:101-811(-)
MAPCKREARRPEGLQHRLGRKQRRLLRLSAVPHVRHGVVALRKCRDAHDGAGRPESVAFVVERSRHVRKVRAEDRVFVARAAPLLQKVLVPPERKRDVRVDLQHKRLSSVHAARDVSRENGTGGVARVHPIDTNPAEVLAPHVGRPRLLSVAHRRAIWVSSSKDTLVDDGHRDALGVRCHRERRSDGLSALEIPIGCHAQENCWCALARIDEPLEAVVPVGRAGGVAPETWQPQAR